MLSISHSRRRSNAFDVKISEPGTGWRGYTVIADDITEVQQAVEHYYSMGKHGYQDRRPNCPLCRMAEAEEAKMQKADARRKRAVAK